jgi:hypothetical protein
MFFNLGIRTNGSSLSCISSGGHSKLKFSVARLHSEGVVRGISGIHVVAQQAAREIQGFLACRSLGPVVGVDKRQMIHFRNSSSDPRIRNAL